MYRNINENFGDPIEFETLAEMAQAIRDCGYELPEDGLQEGRDYEIIDNITPRVAPENIRKVIKEYYGRPDGVDLDNGVYVRLHGDGTGQGDDGRTYIAISRELENDGYELLGYADINDTEA